MIKTDVIRQAMIAAMKAKDKPRKDALSMLLGALKNAQIDKRSDLTEAEENAVIKKEIRKTQETFDTAPAGRQDIKDEAAKILAIYKEFVPADMSQEQVTATIRDILKELGIEVPVPADKGRIMKSLMPLVKGKADGKMVNETLSAMMK